MKTFVESLNRLLSVGVITEGVEDEINDYFDKEIKRLVDKFDDPDVKAQLRDSIGINWAGIVYGAAKKKGLHRFNNDYVELISEVSQEMFTKGNPFDLFDPDEGVPIRTWISMNAVWAADRVSRSLSIGGREMGKGKFVKSFSFSDVAEFNRDEDDDLGQMEPVSPEEADLEELEAFRTLVKKRLGKLGLDVLDAKMDAVDQGKGKIPAGQIVDEFGNAVPRAKISYMLSKIRELYKWYSKGGAKMHERLYGEDNNDMKTNRFLNDFERMVSKIYEGKFHSEFLRNSGVGFYEVELERDGDLWWDVDKNESLSLKCSSIVDKYATGDSCVVRIDKINWEITCNNPRGEIDDNDIYFDVGRTTIDGKLVNLPEAEVLISYYEDDIYQMLRELCG